MTARTFIDILKGNPWHDPTNGRFTSGPAGGGTASAGGMSAKEYKQKISDLEAKRDQSMEDAVAALDNGDTEGFNKYKKEYEELKEEIKREKQAFLDDGGAEKLSEYAREVVREQEDSIRNLPKERAIIVNREGDIVFEKDGDDFSVGFDYAELAGKKGMIFTHNHPDNPMHVPMLSPGDVDVFAQIELGEMRAASQKGPTYSIKRKNVQGDDAWFFSRKYEEAWENAMEYKTQKLRDDGSVDAMRSGKITEKELYIRGSAYATDYLVKFCQSNAEEYGLEFKVENAEVK